MLLNLTFKQTNIFFYNFCWVKRDNNRPQWFDSKLKKTSTKFAKIISISNFDEVDVVEVAVVARIGVLEEEEEVFQILNLIACVLISVAKKEITPALT